MTRWRVALLAALAASLAAAAATAKKPPVDERIEPQRARALLQVVVEEGLGKGR